MAWRRPTTIDLGNKKYFLQKEKRIKKDKTKTQKESIVIAETYRKKIEKTLRPTLGTGCTWHKNT